MARKPTDIVQYKLRIRESLRRRIEQAAKKSGVSANQEMVGRLERSFELGTARKLESLEQDLATLNVSFEGLMADRERLTLMVERLTLMFEGLEGGLARLKESVYGKQ